MTERPQYFENTLGLSSIDAATLSKGLQDLRFAVQRGAQMVDENTSISETWGPNGMFRAFPGISSPSQQSTIPNKSHI